jgi:hypothetical protein
MKTNIGLAMYALVATSWLHLLTTLSSAETDCWVHRKVPLGTGIYAWSDRHHGCYDGGVDCIVEPCTSLVKGKVTPVPPYGYAIELQLDQVTLSVKDSQGNWNTFTRDGRNYYFTPTEEIEIVECTEYPQLVGITINLGGIVTDDTGKYTVFVPTP